MPLTKEQKLALRAGFSPDATKVVLDKPGTEAKASIKSARLVSDAIYGKQRFGEDDAAYAPGYVDGSVWHEPGLLARTRIADDPNLGGKGELKQMDTRYQNATDVHNKAKAIVAKDIALRDALNKAKR